MNIDYVVAFGEGIDSNDSDDVAKWLCNKFGSKEAPDYLEVKRE